MEQSNYNDRDILTILGNRIRLCRLSRHMTQSDLSLKTGIACYYISRIETGQLNIGINMLYKLAKGLKVHISELVQDL